MKLKSSDHAPGHSLDKETGIQTHSSRSEPAVPIFPPQNGVHSWKS